MSLLVQNRLGNICSRLKPSISIAVSSGFIKNLSTVSERLPETLDDDSLVSKEIWNVIVGRVGDRVSEDDVLNRLLNLSDGLVFKLLYRFRDDWRSALGVLKWAETCKGRRNSSECCDLVVDILGKAKKWDQMMEFVERMRGEYNC